ncbi:MAG: long-chain fatty acid--CoA ligase [Proteobacteria bacterium]|nr:long-chain fatty acid--CoA ligase [Pseudomonadota bacterium]
MSDRHFAYWPKGLPRHMTIPETDLFYNVDVSAKRFPDKPYLVFYDTTISFKEFKDEAERIAGFLEHECGVKKGDRVLLFMQNSPQFVLAYYGILRANAVVVPINPMNLTNELRHYVSDSGAVTAIIAQDLYAQMKPLLGEGLQHILVAAYSDYLKRPTDLKVPEFIAAPRLPIADPGVTLWSDALAKELQPGPVTVGPDDLCVMPYTSGTTGNPKGCMHTHRSAMSTLVAGIQWFGIQQDSTFMAVLPFFHVTGMQGAMSGPLFCGITVVLLPRWDREAAAQCVQRYGVTGWTAIPTMIIDFLMNPNLDKYDLSTITRMSGGGAAMPEAIAQKLLDRGITYVEGYGLSETIAPTHINPPDRAKKQCLGIPIFDVEARVVDPQTFTELPPGEVGEIVVNGPQVFLGYWNNPQGTADAFVDIGGKRFFRTGDLGRTDEDGYFFMVDRLKRMINASGYKVWPAEVEALMYQHPAIQEACVISAKDAHRGETVKCLVSLKEAYRGKVTEQEIVDWASRNMAAYKYPRIVEFIETLPKSATGKVQWRALQEREQERTT